MTGGSALQHPVAAPFAGIRSNTKIMGGRTCR
jgi:hypothetical protein